MVTPPSLQPPPSIPAPISLFCSPELPPDHSSGFSHWGQQHLVHLIPTLCLQVGASGCLCVPGTWTSAGSAQSCAEKQITDSGFFASVAFTEAALSRSSFCICLRADSETSPMQISLPACRSWAKLSMYRDAFRSREPKIRLLMPHLAPES